ncbi:MAG: hypothetical protein KDM81_22460, partial [Verrucomicrobiae bacterium]|nr:hypothetical protein [Verrucomicrobiae bacterium]
VEQLLEPAVNATRKMQGRELVRQLNLDCTRHGGYHGCEASPGQVEPVSAGPLVVRLKSPGRSGGIRTA